MKTNFESCHLVGKSFSIYLWEMWKLKKRYSVIQEFVENSHSMHVKYHFLFFVKTVEKFHLSRGGTYAKWLVNVHTRRYLVALSRTISQCSFKVLYTPRGKGAPRYGIVPDGAPNNTVLCSFGLRKGTLFTDLTLHWVFCLQGILYIVFFPHQHRQICSPDLKVFSG